MKALIPAAGLGSRFLPATKAQPKEMLLVVDRPVIQYVVEEGLASAADEVIIINSHDKKSIEEHFTPNPALEAELRSRGKDKYADKVAHAGNLNVSYVYQDEPLGLGHAVHCAADRIEGEPFFVLLGDVLVPDNQMLIKMKEVSDAHNDASVIAVLPVAKEEVDRFGVIAGEALSDDVWKVSSSKSRQSRRLPPIWLCLAVIFFRRVLWSCWQRLSQVLVGRSSLPMRLMRCLKKKRCMHW